MCKIEGNRRKLGDSTAMELKALGGSKIDKLKSSMVSSGLRVRPWLIRLTTTVMLWTCIVQLISLREVWGPGVLKGWPSCFSHESAAAAVSGVEENPLSVPPKIVFPPKREFFCSFLLRPGFNFCLLKLPNRSDKITFTFLRELELTENDVDISS